MHGAFRSKNLRQATLGPSSTEPDHAGFLQRQRYFSGKACVAFGNLVQTIQDEQHTTTVQTAQERTQRLQRPGLAVALCRFVSG